MHNVTKVLSERSTFFRKNNSDRAMFTIMEVIKGIRMNEQVLFRQVTKDSHELTISERIWQAIVEFVAAITKVFSIDDEEVLDAMVNESDELAHICELYQCKMAS